jgi:hypothetical protein
MHRLALVVVGMVAALVLVEGKDLMAGKESTQDLMAETGAPLMNGGLRIETTEAGTGD